MPMAVLAHWLLRPRVYTQVEKAFQKLRGDRNRGFLDSFFFFFVQLSTLDPVLSETRVSGEGRRGLGTEGRFLKE